MNGVWDIRRIEATLRTMYKLRDLVQTVNELWEHPEREILVGEKPDSTQVANKKMVLNVF